MNRLCPFAALVLALSLPACAGETTESEPLGDTESAVTAASCSPDGAEGAVNRFQKALHDSIAFAEGTGGKSANDGYDVGFAYKKFSSCSKHPNIKTCSGKLCSTAAGRYQFLKRTWDPTATAIKATSFSPANQEKGAEHLVKKVRKVTIPTNRALTATEFSNAMKKLSYEWASLPPGRYGQPNRTEAALRTDYCSNVGDDGC